MFRRVWLQVKFAAAATIVASLWPNRWCWAANRENTTLGSPYLKAQGDSEKVGFSFSRDERDGFSAFILEYFNRPGGWFWYAFEQGDSGAGECEDVSRSMVKAVHVAIFTHCHVLVAMHDLYLPVISVEPQNGFGSGRFQAGNQVGGLCFDLCDVACPDMLAKLLTWNAAPQPKGRAHAFATLIIDKRTNPSNASSGCWRPCLPRGSGTWRKADRTEIKIVTSAPDVQNRDSETRALRTGRIANNAWVALTPPFATADGVRWLAPVELFRYKTDS